MYLYEYRCTPVPDFERDLYHAYSIEASCE